MDRKGYKTIVTAALWIALGFAACKKDTPADNSVTPVQSAENVYVVCEGSLGQGNGTLYLYNTANDSVYGDIYSQVNHQALGDVFQSMKVIGDNIYLCVNNSDKIVVINHNTWQLVGTISVPKPRYITSVSLDKAYVSSLFDNKVYVINPTTLQVTNTIDMPAKNTEGMMLYGNDLYVCTWDTTANHVYIVDKITNQLTDSIALNGYAPQEIIRDKEQKLWILSGNEPNHKTAMWTRIDPSTREVLKRYTFPAGADPLRPVINQTGDTIYYIEADFNGGTQNNGIYRMDIHATDLPTQPLIQAQQNQYFWALGLDPQSGNIFVGDPKGFIQQGSVYIYNRNGSMLRQFKTGVGPGHFLFDY